MRRLSIGLALSFAFVVGCANDLPHVEAVSTAIVGGRVDTTHREVVFLFNVRGSSCTASVIAPRVVLTAKHCVQGGANFAAPARDFRVYVGNNTRSFTAEYRVQEVRPAPGCWDLCGDASDVAVLIMSEPIDIPTRELATSSPSTLTGQEITAVGFGQTPSGSFGTRLRTTSRVSGVSGGLIFVDPAVCQGDSGGPVIGPDEKIYGVASFIVDLSGGGPPVCGTADGAYNAIEPWLDLINDAIEETGTCVPRGDEICDGIDNNCDGATDETCTPIGGACAANDECVGELCEMTAGGRVCTAACNPLTPEVGCPSGLYCARTSGCEGLCAPGARGAKGNDADCAADTECASLFCADPGDGRRRCLAACRGDAGSCFAGEVCAANPGDCGGCVPSGIVSGLRGLGEPCDDAMDCGSSFCFEDRDVAYCSRMCADDAACGAGFHCRGGACVRGAREGIGGGCVTNEDCVSGLCATRGDTSWCTVVCTSDAECATGLACQSVGSVSACVPTKKLVGEACAAAEECISGLCVDVGRGSVCTRTCSPEVRCSPGFECVRTVDGVTGACVAPQPARRRGDGGCSVSEQGARPGAGATLLVAVAVAAGGLARRRRRTRAA